MHDDAKPTLFCLHFLGGSAREWDQIASHLTPHMQVVALDLPGFGTQAATPGYAVAEMADHVALQIRAAAPHRWLLAGHSLGAKVAALLARRAEDGDPGLHGLAGIVTLGGSPPGPEPMEEAKRQDMLTWFGGTPEQSRRQASGYIRANLGAPLDPEIHDRLVEAMLPARRAAWTAWLEHGSKEDWSDRIGVLRTRALLLGGTKDPALGAPAQDTHLLRHFADVETVALSGAGHLLPVERPAVIARLIVSRFAPNAAIPPDYLALIHSARVSTGTRAALLARAAPPDPAGDLTAAERGTLRALVDRVVPQAGPTRIDLATTLANQVPTPGDGWRNAVLPPDLQAWRAGLQTVDAIAHGFAGQDEATQDATLDRIAAGRGGGHGAGLLDAKQMQAWFEDLRADATRLYIAHPATSARLRYSGIGYGGDGPDKPGFTQIGINQRDAWEPA